ncbi:MAG: hypothetical protein ABI665_15265 [Vicinamibacterales bacterium]
MPARIFLLSPAHCGGRRAGILMREGSALPIARRLHDGTLSLGDAFSFMSGLYFRGKLAYARAFARTNRNTSDPVLVITPTRGLLPAETPVSLDLLQEFAAVDIATAGAQYLDPLERDLEVLAGRLGTDEWVVLLGSVATGKYADILTKWLDERVRYPVAFAGRGDMSRGGLLLRSAAAAEELEYAVLRAGVRPRGKRPPKLTPL